MSGVAPSGLLMDYRIDRNRKEVTADLAGLVTSRSVFLGAQGCRIAHEGAVPAATDDDPPIAAKQPAKPLPIDPVDPALEAALDREFTEPESGPHRWKLAVEAPAPVAAWRDPKDPRHPLPSTISAHEQRHRVRPVALCRLARRL
jgi:hypothetical protein